MSGDEIERHYSLDRVSDLTSYSVKRLRDLIRSGDLEAERWGRSYRVTETALRAFIEARRQAEIPEPQRPGSRPGARQDE